MIQIYNRKTKSYEEEQVVGKKYIEWIYDSLIGKNLTEIFFKKKLFSKLYGLYCDTKLSANKINTFINDYNIDINLSLKKANEFDSFNDFFARKLTSSARKINLDPNVLISPGDGRLTCYTDISIYNLVQVKNITYSLIKLINDDNIANNYENGVCLILRLAPTDYHRFHFIDSGIPSKSHFINGFYYSVNPIALKNIANLFCENKREWTLFKSDNFGEVLMIEVGATCVGSIIQTYEPGVRINKGDEKGYFKFGGSTIILFFKKDTVKIDDDILQQSDLGFESKVCFGESIGHKY